MIKMMFILFLVGAIQIVNRIDKPLCDSFIVSVDILDYRDSVTSSGKKVIALKESENWANDDFQYGYGFVKIPDSVCIRVSIWPDYLGDGEEFPTNRIRASIGLNMKFGLGVDCKNVKNPILKNNVATKTYTLTKKDFEARVTAKAVQPLVLQFNLPIASLIKKNEPSHYYLNQLIVNVSLMDEKKNECRIEYVRPVCLKRFGMFQSPY